MSRKFCVVFVVLRETDVRFVAIRVAVESCLDFCVGVRVALRDTLAERVAVWGVGARVARDATFVVARGDSCFVSDVRDTVETLFFVRCVVERSRKTDACLLFEFMMRAVVPGVVCAVGVSDFCLFDVTVFVVPRRVAARAASSDSVAHTLPNPSSARHTAKITLNPFILM